MNNCKKYNRIDIDLKLLCFTLLLFLSLPTQGAKRCLTVNYAMQSNGVVSDDSLVHYQPHERYIIPPIPVYEAIAGSTLVQESTPSLITIFTRKESSPTPLLALKTNLLFDAVTALNIEVEVPIN